MAKTSGILSKGGRSPAPLRPGRVPGETRERAPALALLGLCTLVEPALEMGELGLELQVAVPALLRERPVRERGLDRTTWLALVAAVGEAAVGEEGGDVVEGLFERLVRDPELELAQLEKRLDKRAQADERKRGRALSRFQREASRAKGRR